MSKNLRIILIVSLGLIASVAVTYFTAKHPIVKETSRTEFQQWVQDGAITEAKVNPTPYAGIYAVEGKRKEGGELKEFDITTHLEADQIKALLAKPEIKVEIPGKGTTTQILNI